MSYPINLRLGQTSYPFNVTLNHWQCYVTLSVVGRVQLKTLYQDRSLRDLVERYVVPKRLPQLSQFPSRTCPPPNYVGDALQAAGKLVDALAEAAPDKPLQWFCATEPGKWPGGQAGAIYRHSWDLQQAGVLLPHLNMTSRRLVNRYFANTRHWAILGKRDFRKLFRMNFATCFHGDRDQMADFVAYLKKGKDMGLLKIAVPRTDLIKAWPDVDISPYGNAQRIVMQSNGKSCDCAGTKKCGNFNHINHFCEEINGVCSAISDCK